MSNDSLPLIRTDDPHIFSYCRTVISFCAMLQMSSGILSNYILSDDSRIIKHSPCAI